MSVRYDRTPSPGFLDLFRPGGLLASLCRKGLYWVGPNNEKIGLDLQFREKNKAALYCGLTKIVVVSLSRGGVKVSANRTYARQVTAQSGFFRSWLLTESPDDFKRNLDSYLKRVEVAPQWYSTEGRVQARWLGNEPGTSSRPPWTPIDREAVLGYDDTPEANAALSGKVWSQARRTLKALRASGGWAEHKEKKSQELDLIAVGGDGSELVLIEVKPSSASKVYYAPFQLFRYTVAWHAALSSASGKSVVNGLNDLVRDKAAVWLLPKGMPRFKDERSELALRPVVAIDSSEPIALSEEVWSRMLRVFQSMPWSDFQPYPRVLQPQLWGWPPGGSPMKLFP